MGRKSDNRRLYLYALHRDGPWCHLCGMPINTVRTKDRDRSPLSGTADHITPRSAGGQTITENIQAAHRYCNMQRGSKEITAQLKATLRAYVRSYIDHGQPAADRMRKREHEKEND